MEFPPEKNRFIVLAAKTMQTEPTRALYFFFSNVNIDYIQSRSIDEVLKATGVQIRRQDDNEVFTIMMNEWQYTERGSIFHLLDAYKMNSNINSLISELNKRVITEIVRQVVQGVKARSMYIRDASTLPTPEPRPVAESSKSRKMSIQPNIAFKKGGMS